MPPVWPQRLVFATIVLLIIAVGVSAAWPAGPDGRKVVNIAHRGGIADGYPENTLAAFRRAMAVGADVIELDIKGTKDARLVILHDETLDRTTDGTGPVTDFTLAELEELTAGSSEEIPTLEEVLHLKNSTRRSEPLALLPPRSGRCRCRSGRTESPGAVLYGLQRAKKGARQMPRPLPVLSRRVTCQNGPVP
jgi:hypothetical protein